MLTQFGKTFNSDELVIYTVFQFYIKFSTNKANEKTVLSMRNCEAKESIAIK